MIHPKFSFTFQENVCFYYYILLYQRFFLLLSCIISGTLCIAGKFNKRLLNVFAILFLIFLYSLSIANSSVQIFLHFPSKMWPFLFFNSLLLLPAALSAFFRTFFTSTWAKIFLWMRIFFLLWIPIQLLIVNYLNVSFIMLFNFFHVFCIVSSLVFIIGSIQNWKRFEVIQKIPIYGNFAFLVFAIIEIIISKFTMNMSVPLLPFGGLLLFISLTIYTFKLYQLIEKRFKELQEIKSSREQRDPLSRQKRLMGINQQKIIADIENLMNNEKLFCDEDLSLNRLSDILEIRSDQLSQIINDYFHNTFTRFINGYRIEYAKELLREGNAKIIQIAFQVGFQSKSTFNSEFKRVTKMTPKEYLQSLKIDSKED
jgi:AraC-like DNA-binding protein